MVRSVSACAFGVLVGLLIVVPHLLLARRRWFIVDRVSLIAIPTVRAPTNGWRHRDGCPIARSRFCFGTSVHVRFTGRSGSRGDTAAVTSSECSRSDASSFATVPELLAAMLTVRATAVEAEAQRADALDALAPQTRPSGANLVHYIAIRQLDLRREQRSLARLGLSSLGRAEPHVLATIDAVIARLAAEVPGSELPDDLGRRGPSAGEASRLLEEHTLTSLGPTVGDRNTRLMVTLPTEAAHDSQLVDRFVGSGMSIARINTAHDDLECWRRMIANVRRRADAAGRDVRVAIDLPGPKLRTGPLPSGTMRGQATEKR